MTPIPWTDEPRPDTRITNARLGIWLFLASEAMLFGSLFSGYVLLRTASPNWPDARSVLHLWPALVNTALLIGATLALGGVRTSTSIRPRTAMSALLAVAFLILKAIEYRGRIAEGLLPSTNLLLASWFTITGVHWLHVAGGVGANVWLAMTPRLPGALERFHAVRLYWYFVDLVWLSIVIGFYVV